MENENTEKGNTLLCIIASLFETFEVSYRGGGAVA